MSISSIYRLAAVLFTIACMFAVGAPAVAAPALQASANTGIVGVQTVNVRAQPNTSSAVVGKLTKNTTVEILGSQGTWLHIIYPSAPGGTGWVSRRFITRQGLQPAATPAGLARQGQSAGSAQQAPQATPTPTGSAQQELQATPTPTGSAQQEQQPVATPTGSPQQEQSAGSAQQAPAPRLVAYNFPNFQWTWPGAQLENVDWYFDLQIFQSGVSNPYKTIAVNPTDVPLRDNVYSFDARQPEIKCDSYWLVQIAKRENGRFVGWISDKSDQQQIGESCSGSGGGSGGSSGGNGGGSGGSTDNSGEGPCETCRSRP